MFARNLTIGSSGQDVILLKKIISLEFNSTLDTSPTYTSDTANDVSNLQEKYTSTILTPNGLSSGTGTVGASTRAKLNQLAIKYGLKLSDSSTSQASTGKVFFATNLQLGSSGDDVLLLKTILNSDYDTKIVANSNTINNVFDSATVDAVNRFQMKYSSDILTPAGLISGTGTVGPSTRKKLNSILNVILGYIQTIGSSATSSDSILALSSSTLSTLVNDFINANPSNTQVAPPIANKSDSFAPIITLNAEPTKVTTGQTVLLLWKSTNVSGQCKIVSKDSANNTYSGSIDFTGAEWSNPIKTTTTFTITCYNKYGIPGTTSLLVTAVSPATSTKPATIYIKSPVINSISPLGANRGDTVTINGQNFLTTNDIYFGGLKIDSSLILSQSSTSISFQIPVYQQCGIVYCPPPSVDTNIETGGPIVIQVSNTNGFSNDFIYKLPSKIITIKGVAPVLVQVPLSISSISPSQGNRGDTATITGTGFTSDTIILFSGFKVANNLILSKTNTSITFTIPPFQIGCTEPSYEICPKLPIAGNGTIIETGGNKTVYVINATNKATTTSLIFTLPSKKITY